MDKADPTARIFLASMADLLGAVRLPEGAMRAAAGTDVVVDILFFQKRGPDEPAKPADWIDLAEVLPPQDGEEAISINRTFVEHPGMVLGSHARTSSAYGPTYTCRPARPEQDSLSQELLAALHTLPADIYTAPAPVRRERETLIDETIRVGTAAEGATIKEGSYLVVKDRLAQIVDGKAVAVQIRNGKGSDGIPARHGRIIRGLVQIRDAVREVLRAQEADLPWGGAQVRLRAAYAHFKREFGPINLTTLSETTGADGEVRETARRPNLQPFLDDPDVWLVSSIEDYDAETGIARQGPIFTERVLHPPVTPQVTSAADALAVALHETGVVDLDRIAELLGVTREAAIAELGNRIFLDPQAWRAGLETWRAADAYLSGPVRKKLEIAIDAAFEDPRFQRNVGALEETLPEDLKPSEITARLGAPWIPADVIASFCEDILGVTTRVYHTVEIASWTIDVNAFLKNPASTTDWGTLRRHAGELVSDALNSTLPQIYDMFLEDGVEKRVLNAADTEAAKDKLAKIKQGFEAWIWTDAERADRLAKIYNERFNNLVPRRFDGSHLTIPGASSVIKFYEHQKRAIWRILSAGSTYVAHAVGAGKTFTLAASVMEQKRLGLITKPMMTVPGHCLAQAAREFLQLYPTANILVADETNFVKDKRQRFLARAATANWDCIIITHSAFKFIPAPADFERALISDVIGSYVELLDRVDAQDRVSRKRIERMKEGMEARLEGLKSRKDDMLTIAEIGVDQVIVDEMQEFRKLTFTTNQSTLKGVDPDGSQRAWDLYVKSRFLASKRAPMRALIAASGTPITNTLGEMFTIQRFFQPEMLAERGIQEFDAWAAAFGETTTDLELQPSGLYKPVTRFAEFVNIPELIAMFRDFADVVLQSELRQNLKLPKIAGGQRKIIAVPASPAFKTYQKVLAQRIKEIEQRQRKPQKGDDILDFKRSAAKQRLFNDMNAGKKRILIGSSETMGTGVNAHRRLVALHHLDVPWLPSQVAQREGRIERQGNQNDEIELFAYATKGSVDATGWQTLERKARFIDMAMSGDPSIRRIEDAGAQANQFGLAKAIASGDQRLIQKAGLEAEIARLERQRDNHFDEQIAIRRKIDRLHRDAEEARIRILEIESDIEKRKPTRGDAFEITVDGKAFRERKDAGALLIKHIRKAETEKPFKPRMIGAVGGFDLRLGRDMFGWPALLILRTGRDEAVKCEADLTPLGLISRLEHSLARFEASLGENRGIIAQAGTWLPSLQSRLGVPFALQGELDEKLAELASINASLAATTADADLDPAPKRPDPPSIKPTQGKSPCSPQRSRAS